ncbi:MAG: cupin domain-containing protein [Pseudomonadota bacterium]
MTQTTAREIIATLRLEPHPEGGWYRETWRAAAAPGERAAGTAIYFLLDAGEFSHWHRVDADETWHHYAGAPLSLSLSPNGHDAEARVLGTEILAGQAPQITVPAGWWQAATSLGAWTLVGCTVSPGFVFEGFELAPPDWRPTPRPPGMQGA